MDKPNHREMAMAETGRVQPGYGQEARQGKDDPGGWDLGGSIW